MKPVLPTIILIVVASVPASALNVSVPGYTVETYATYTVSAQDIPRHMTFDANGNLYVTQQVSGTIWKITPSRIAAQFASGFTTPYSIAWGGGTPYGDYLYVGHESITKVDLNGNTTFFANQRCNASMTIDRIGNYGGFLYVGDGCVDDIEKINAAGSVTVFSPWPGSASGGPYGIDFDPGIAYGGLMYVGTEYGQSDAYRSGLFSMSTGGIAIRFSSNLVQVWDVDFDKTGLFAGLLFVIGKTSFSGPPSIYSVGVDGIAADFATSTMLNGHGMAFGPDGAMYISEYSSPDSSVIISRIAPAVAEVDLTKTDDVDEGDCVIPDQQINYTISYEFSGAGDTNVVLIDYLPIEVDYDSSNPPGDYNDANRTVTWNIGTVPPDSSAEFTLTCIVNYDADPCSVITNICQIIGDSTLETTEVNTATCFWNQIIYVDCNATGLDNGLTWEDAYNDLQDALVQAAGEGNYEIWVARGTYKPSVPEGSPTFQFIDGVPIYGHFAGGETSRAQRNLSDPNNETILSGVGIPVYYVVSASGCSPDNILDGFKITNCTYGTVRIENACLVISNCLMTGNPGNGIYAFNANFSVADCIIKNSSNGILAKESSFMVSDCNIHNNSNKGIEFDLNYKTNIPGSILKSSVINNNSSYGIELNRATLISSLIVKECKISNNGVGIYARNGSCATFLNNFIYDNGMRGFILQNPGEMTIRNNTILGHSSSGIYRIDGGTNPSITNCILWANNDDLYGCNSTYSNIEDNDAGTGNIHADPCFVDADINDFHIRPFSACVNAGDPNFADLNEVDIDNQPRIMIGQTTPRVDIGADEIGWPKADYNQDEVINFTDYTILTSAWLTTDPDRSLDSDEDVDIDDLTIFSDYWLWNTP